MSAPDIVAAPRSVDLRALAALPGYGAAKRALDAAGHYADGAHGPVWEVDLEVTVTVTEDITITVAAADAEAAREAARAMARTDPEKLARVAGVDGDDVEAVVTGHPRRAKPETEPDCFA